METFTKAKVLRIYVSNTDVVKHKSVYEIIAQNAKQYGLAGATVFKGVMGYGASNELHSDKLWMINDKFPVVIEIIDEIEKIDGFLKVIAPWLEALPKGCLVTCHDTLVIMEKCGAKKNAPVS